MKIIKNRFIPFAPFAAINLFGVIFKRPGVWLHDVEVNHEAIHSAQMREMLWIPFYVVYVLEWLLRLAQYRSPMKAYRNISFEREAYKNQRNLRYLKSRKCYSQWR